MQPMMDIIDDKSVEKEEAEMGKHFEIQISTNKEDPCGLTEEHHEVSEAPSEGSPYSQGVVANTVHVQHAHSFQTTTVLPRVSSEQSKLRILTRTPAVQSMSSPPPEESFEDLTQDIVYESGLRHQNLSKDDSESGPPSLSSSRDSSFDYTDSTGTDLNEFIVKTLKNQRDKKMILKLEKDFLAFISDPRKVILQYPPMTSYHRMIVHRVAAYFGLDHNVDHSGKCIIVNKCSNTRFPEIRFSDLVREDSEEDPLPRLILKRQSSSFDESTPPEGSSPLSRRHTLEDKKSKSIEEREEEYSKARARIFNRDSSSQSSASSKDGDCCLSASGDTSIDDDTEKLPNDQIVESEDDKTTGVLQPAAVKVLSNNSRSPEALSSSNLIQDVCSKIDTSSSASLATVTTTWTDSKFNSNLSTGLPDTVTILAEGAPLLAGNIPTSDVSIRSPLVGPAGMIPLLSPNQTGGVVWTLPESQCTYSSGPGSMFVHNAGAPVVGPDGYQNPNVAMQQGLGTMQSYFYPGQTSQGYQTQPQRQPTPPQQQTPGLAINSPYGPQPAFSIYQQSRMYPQQDVELLPQQQAGPQGNPHGMVVAGSQSSNYQDMSNQLAEMALGSLEQQESAVYPKHPPGTYSPSCTQTFPAGQPVQYMVYRHGGTMLAQPITNQASSGYMYSSPSSQGYTQPPYNPQIYNQQLYAQPHAYTQPYTISDQTMLDPGNGSHTPPTPPPNALPMGTNPGFIAHVPSISGTNPRQQLSTQVINPALTQVPARLMNPYSIQGQQLVHMPGGVQQIYACSPPFSVGQTTIQPIQQPPPNRYTCHSKPVDIYNPDPISQRRPSPSGSPRGNMPGSGQNRRLSGGLAGKGSHGKYDGQRSQHQQIKGKQKHKRNQHRHSADSNRKQPHPGPSVLEQELSPAGANSCVLEVYDVSSNTKDVNEVVDDLRQAGAQIIWNDKISQSTGNITAKATFHSSLQAEQALRTNSNPNYKLRRCPATEINVTESHDY